MKQIIFKKVIFSGSVIFLLLLSLGNLQAQDSTQYKKNEVWANFFNPGVTYKRGLNSKTFLKAGITFDFNKGKTEQKYFSGFGDQGDTTKYKNNTQQTSIYIGLEKRYTLSPKMTLFHGPELSFGFSNYNRTSNQNNVQQETHQKNKSIGAGYTIGAIYSFNSFLGLGVMWSPRIYYSFYKNVYSSQYRGLDPQVTSKQENKDNTLGVQLSTPTVSLILRF